MTRVLAVVGPTASGKTALAIALAEKLRAEIVSADSMQFYGGMEIGTGAPSAEELQRVKHHFIGFLDPSEKMSAGAYQIRARDLIETLQEANTPVVVVGGSGLYIRALLDGLFTGPGANPEIRDRLTEEAEQDGLRPLYERLKEVDPDYAATIESTDPVRIVRALEVYELTGRPFSELHEEHEESPEPIPAQQVALDWPREILYDRIERRVDAMIEQGFIEEVEKLIESGYETDLRRLKSLGYREVLAYLQGETSLNAAVDTMKMHTRRYAKRQLTWFRSDPRIHWINPKQHETPEAQAERFL